MAIVYPICCFAGSPDLLDQIEGEGAGKTLRVCIEDRDTPGLFDWLIRALSYQGVSDAAASSYMDRHGSVGWTEVEYGLTRNPPCPKLTSYWSFDGCGYSKWKQTCACPEHFARCPVPRHRLRNGRLNQTAYSLFLFLRDVAGCDLVGWIDERLTACAGRANAPVAVLRIALLGPLAHVYGIADKVLSMAFASLLLAAPVERSRWRELGASLIAVDSLVHKLLHRTGILRRFGADHLFGPACYAPNGCAEIVEKVAGRIDAREFNMDFPRVFPRFVQHALWRCCAQDGLNICNSIRIADLERCADIYCRVYRVCDRVPIQRTPT
ncbi:MAG TPA: hypothetical protein VGU01_01190 [Sphingomicrobium sp.]|nr:hypothetical protein [Sphingomicrobium sp.]